MLLQGQLDSIWKQTGKTVRREWRIASEAATYWLGRSAVALYTHAMLRMDVEWQGSLPDGPKIIAANHPTTTDPIFTLALIPEQVSVLVTGGAFDIPIFGSYLRQAGHVPVVHNSGGATIREATRLLKAGRSMSIFPEGSLSPLEGGIGFHRPHSGVARLALGTGAPVIPLGIGLDPAQIRFVDVEMEGQPEAGRLYLHGPYAVTVGAPLWFRGDVRDRAQVCRVAERIMQRIRQLARESIQRVEGGRVPERRLDAGVAGLAPVGWGVGPGAGHREVVGC